MSKNCLKDDLLLTHYFQGVCSELASQEIANHLASCAKCQSHFAHLASLLSGLDESEYEDIEVPPSLTLRAMELFDTVQHPRSVLSLAIKLVGGFLSPFSEGPQPIGAHVLRGESAHVEDLTYHVTVGQFSLAVELNSAEIDQIDLSVRPLQPVAPGWTIRIIEGETTRRLSNFDTKGIQVDALGQGVYTVALEHQHEEEHQFYLRLASEDD